MRDRLSTDPGRVADSRGEIPVVSGDVERARLEALVFGRGGAIDDAERREASEELARLLAADAEGHSDALPSWLATSDTRKGLRRCRRAPCRATRRTARVGDRES
jgi:hypothetical protein